MANGLLAVSSKDFFPVDYGDLLYSNCMSHTVKARNNAPGRNISKDPNAKYSPTPVIRTPLGREVL